MASIMHGRNLRRYAIGTSLAIVGVGVVATSLVSQATVSHNAECRRRLKTGHFRR